MGVGVGEFQDFPNEELSLSEDYPLEEGEEDPGGEGGRLDPPTPWISASKGSVIVSPNV